MFLWHRLQKEKRPILIYGMGNGAEKLLLLAHQYQVPIAGIFASQDHSREGLMFQGYPVMAYDQALGEYPDSVILVAFGVYQEQVLRRIENLSRTHPVYIPDIPLMGGTALTPQWIQDHQADITQVKALFSDEKSLQVFDTMLEAKLTGHLPAYFRQDTPRMEDMKLLRLNSQEHYLDLGAYNGDTVEEFLALTAGSYGSITVFEPDEHNLRKLTAAVSHLNHLTIHQKASWNQHTTLTFSGKGGRNCAKAPSLPGQYKHLHPVEAIPVDSLNQNFTYVKMDVEGAEAETLWGMQETLNRSHPKLLISAYHRPEDFITLPLLLQGLCPGYQMYLRRNRCLPAWEIQLYCIYREDNMNS